MSGPPIVGPTGIPLVGQPVGVPMGVQLAGLEGPKGIELESVRMRFILAAMSALLTRESSTLASMSALGRLAVNAADATIAAMGAPRASTANPEGVTPGPA